MCDGLYSCQRRKYRIPAVYRSSRRRTVAARVTDGGGDRADHRDRSFVRRWHHYIRHTGHQGQVRGGSGGGHEERPGWASWGPVQSFDSHRHRVRPSASPLSGGPGRRCVGNEQPPRVCRRLGFVEPSACRGRCSRCSCSSQWSYAPQRAARRAHRPRRCCYHRFPHDCIRRTQRPAYDLNRNPSSCPHVDVLHPVHG